jgi:hypothetical protein
MNRSPLIIDFFGAGRILLPSPMSTRERGASRLTPFACLLGLCLAGGCGPSAGTLSGTVTFKDAKVPSGRVSFFADGKLYETKIDGGAYQIRDIPPGEAKVAVIRLDPNQPDPYDALNKARTQMLEGKGAHPREIDPTVVTDPVQLELLQRKRHLLPFVYSSPNTSDLRFTVEAGANTFDIKLQDRPNSN